MSIIINELEVITTPEPPPTGPVDSAVRTAPSAGPTPFDLRAVIRHLADRADRVRAD